MILVISENFEPATDKMMLWLASRGQPALRLNEDTPVSFEWLDIHKGILDFKMCVGDISIASKDVDCLIYRRGQIRWLIKDRGIDKILGSEVLGHYNNELKSISDAIVNVLCNTKPYFGEYKKRYANKLKYLQLATQSGFAIPHTVIGTTAKDINQIAGDKITKPISEVFATVVDNCEFRTLTTMLSDEDFAGTNDEPFFPSLVQERIDIRYEIRVFFYGHGIVHALAIKSSEQDWRGHNTNNKFLTFNLPPQVRGCIDNFIERSGLTTGSIDIIYSSDKKFYFLEVNPVGQFDFFYRYCNVDIEKEIVDKLISHNNECA